MKFKLNVFITLLLLLFFSCSNNKNKNTKENLKEIKSVVSNEPTDKEITTKNEFDMPEIVNSISYLDIMNTDWSFYLNENDKDTYHFEIDSTYSSFSAEMGETYYGTYSITNDTIYIYQKRGEYDEEFKEGSRHRADKLLYAVIIVNGKLKHQYYKELVGDYWRKNDFEFDKDYLYTKETE